jgi:hypothetical protein
MSEKIEPVLSAEEWRPRLHFGAHADETAEVFAGVERGDTIVQVNETWGPNAIEVWNVSDWSESRSIHSTAPELHVIIALANAALPDSDPRKITREILERIREVVKQSDIAYESDDVDTFVNALESYLPPEPETT